MYDDDYMYNDEDEQDHFEELPLDEEEAALDDFSLPEEDLEGIKDLDEE